MWVGRRFRRAADSGGVEVVYEGRPISGQVDIEFDIGPAYYNFVDVRYIGEPVLRERIFAPTQNITYINETVNVTNITYENSRVYNYGPDYDRLSAYSTRPIQRLTLQRETNVDLSAAVRSGAITKVQGNILMVAAPQEFSKAAESAAPKQLKTKIATPELQTGWSDVSDEKTKTELQEKMKKEDSKSIPPAKIEAATSGGSECVVACADDITGRLGNNRRNTPPQPDASAAPAGDEKKRIKGKTKVKMVAARIAVSPLHRSLQSLRPRPSPRRPPMLSLRKQTLRASATRQKSEPVAQPAATDGSRRGEPGRPTKPRNLGSAKIAKPKSRTTEPVNPISTPQVETPPAANDSDG